MSANDSGNADVTRRDLAALLGIVGGALGLSLVSGCASDASASESTSEFSAALTQGAPGAVLWVGTVLGAAPPSARSGDLATNGGPNSTVGQVINANVVVAQGCVSVNDGGGGVFCWDPNGGTDDGGTVIVPVANGTGAKGRTGPCWRRIYSGPVNVRWFGALGQGTDDTAALNLCLQMLVVSSGFYNAVNPVIYMPKGRYNISQTLSPTPNAGFWTLRGDGPGQTVIGWTGATAGQPMLLVQNARTVWIEQLRFKGGSTMPSFAIEFRRVAGNPPGQAAPGDCKVSHVYVALESAHIQSCIGFTCDPGEDSNNEQCHISDCWFENYVQSGIAIQHLNSLSHVITRCAFASTFVSPNPGPYSGYAIDASGGPHSMVTNVGGSFAAYGCTSSGHAATFRFGPGSGRTTSIHHWNSETDASLYSFVGGGGGLPQNIVDEGSNYSLADSTVAAPQVNIGSGVNVSWTAVTVGTANGIYYAVASGSYFSLTGCSLQAVGVQNAGTWIQMASQGRFGANPVVNTGHMRCDDGVDAMVQYTTAAPSPASTTIDLAQMYMRAANVVLLDFPEAVTIDTILAQHVGQSVTFIAYTNVTIKNNGNIRLAGQADFQMPYLSSLTLVKSDATLASLWFETSRRT